MSTWLTLVGLLNRLLWVKHNNSCSTLIMSEAFVFFKVLRTMILVYKGMSSCYMSVDCVRL